MLSTRLVARPGAFALGVLRAYRANQGLLLAGAVAYYSLLSIVPLLILCLIGLSEFVSQQAVLVTLQRYLGWVIPGQSTALLQELTRFLDNRQAIGWVSLASMIFFSSLAFSVLEQAMSVIFVHRVESRPRHYAVAAIIPYACMLVLAAGLLLMTLLSSGIQVIGAASIELFGRSWSLQGISGVMLYLLGVVAEVCVLTAIYRVLPTRRPSWQPAIVGAVTATLLWEVTRRALVWYFSTLSQNSIVYGSMATAIGLLASLDIAASLLLLGAQVIAEYERLSAGADRQLHQSVGGVDRRVKKPPDCR
jgi:YihY family inner membrane protein